MWSDIYILWTSGWLDYNPNPNPNPNTKERKREMFWLEFVFESYFEMGNDVWGEHGCISEECDSFVLENIFWREWQAGTKMS